MLNRNQVIQKLSRFAVHSYNQIKEEETEAIKLWKLLCRQKPGKVDSVFSLVPKMFPYQAVAVDGSQIYPDRHQGISCSLINIGTVHFSYGCQHTPVQLESIPELFLTNGDEDRSIDFVNCYRMELEFAAGYKLAHTAYQKNSSSPLLFFIDGTLIFSYLISKDKTLWQKFLPRYLELLEQFYRERLPIIGYISLPQSKDLITLLRQELKTSHNYTQEAAWAKFSRISDLSLAQYLLKPLQRSQLFTHNSEITSYYPEHLKPYFVYIHTGSEIARIELPAWLAHDTKLFSTSMEIIADQIQKGFGYPLCLTEAHQQAVVKAADREFFYAMLHSYLSKEHKSFMPSRKSFSKHYLNL